MVRLEECFTYSGSKKTGYGVFQPDRACNRVGPQQMLAAAGAVSSLMGDTCREGRQTHPLSGWEVTGRQVAAPILQIRNGGLKVTSWLEAEPDLWVPSWSPFPID